MIFCSMEVQGNTIYNLNIKREPDDYQDLGVIYAWLDKDGCFISKGEMEYTVEDVKSPIQAKQIIFGHKPGYTIEVERRKLQGV